MFSFLISIPVNIISGNRNFKRIKVVVYIFKGSYSSVVIFVSLFIYGSAFHEKNLLLGSHKSFFSFVQNRVLDKRGY